MLLELVSRVSTTVAPSKCTNPFVVGPARPEQGLVSDPRIYQLTDCESTLGL